MPVKLNSTGGGSVTLDVGSTASNFTVTMPSATGAVALANQIGGILSDQVITTSSTWTKPTGDTYSADDYVYFYLTGGGGSGAASRNTSTATTLYTNGGNSGTTLIIGTRYGVCPSSGTLTIGAGGVAKTVTVNTEVEGNDGSSSSISFSGNIFAASGGRRGFIGGNENTFNNNSSVGSTLAEQGFSRIGAGILGPRNVGQYINGETIQIDFRSSPFGGPTTLFDNTRILARSAVGGASATVSGTTPNTGLAGRSMIALFDNTGGTAFASATAGGTAGSGTYGGGGGGAAGRAGTVISGAGGNGVLRVVITRGLVNDPILLLHTTDTFMSRSNY